MQNAALLEPQVVCPFVALLHRAVTQKSIA